ncbi:MAG: ribonuclease D, partial [Alphaproteobacteria bacterium]
MTYQIHFIDTPEAYLNTLERLKDASIYFLDTEFIRERTYRPIVALIQIAINDQEAFLIDPTFEGFEPSLLFNLLDQPDKKVVLHSARQDLEIFYYEYHFSPNNLADTQIMAAALGYGDQIGFDGLVYSITSDVIDKSQQRTNWLLRPLNEKQITYAASDVIYLAKIYPFLEAELHNKKRQAWIADEVSELCDPDIFSITPKMIIKKVRHKLSGKAAIAALHALALFRESLAIEKNLIRTLICPDILLTYLAERRPATIEELQKAKNLKQSAFKHHQEQVLVVIE